MKINGFEKLTLLNYPDHVAAMIFTSGCNFKCSYCQNSIFIDGSYGNIINENDVIEYLKKRKGIIDGLVISGGEPTIQQDLKNFIKKIKELNIDVKLDTNGYRPEVIKELLDEGLIDYIAMDIKQDLNCYSQIIGKKIQTEKILNSIDIIKSSSIDYEFRTTIIKGYHDIKSIKKIAKFLGKNTDYYLQNFEDSENVIDKSLKSFNEEELFDIYNNLKKDCPNLKIRGLKNKLYDKEEIKNV